MSGELSGEQLVANLARSAERIERTKCGKALTEEEVQTLRAVDFLRKIAPRLFKEPTSEVPHD